MKSITWLKKRPKPELLGGKRAVENIGAERCPTKRTPTPGVGRWVAGRKAPRPRAKAPWVCSTGPWPEKSRQAGAGLNTHDRARNSVLLLVIPVAVSVHAHADHRMLHVVGGGVVIEAGDVSVVIETDPLGPG